MKKIISNLGFLIPVLLVIVLIVGEVKCIVKFVNCDFEPSYKAECIYGISMITGVGAITGWMDFGK